MKYSKDVLDGLTKKFGSPIYVFDKNGFIKNYLQLETAMKEHYEEYRLAYSFKTNYTPFICRTAKSLGAYAEVVSGMEYAIAKRIGYADDKIIFNGPCKGREGIQAFQYGSLVNAESLDELQLYCDIANNNPQTDYQIGLRIHLNLGKNFFSRFGMDVESIVHAVQMVSRVDNLRIAGLHCHISRCRDLEAWKKRTEKMLTISSELFNDELDYLDLGSGMYGSMVPEFAAQFDKVPTYEEYAQVTAGLFSEHFKGKRKPFLFTEPGTTLINRFIDFISNVETIKQINSHDIAVLNCSTHNLGETCTLKRLPVTIVAGGEHQRYFESIDLSGYTCLEQDIMIPSFQGKLAKGDYIVFGNTGGYSNVLKPPFIRPNCAMIAEKADGEFTLMKAAETYEDILHTYVF